MELKKLVYPIIIKELDDVFYVFIPDLNMFEEEKSFIGAIEIARDAIGARVIHLEIKNQQLPTPSSEVEARNAARSLKDRKVDYTQGNITYVDLNVQEYRNKLYHRSVKKNCTLPYWLSKKAEGLGINFSKTLKEALIQKVNDK